MKQTIDIEHWNRREHFQFFRMFDDPFFGITVNVDCTATYQQSKEEGVSFFLLSLHKVMNAVNATEPFRYRIEDDTVVCYDVIHVSSTVGRSDGTFGFSFFPYDPSLDTFVASATKEIAFLKETSGLNFNDAARRTDVIHFSSVPWISFTDLKHATSFGINDCVPKISVGKYYTAEGRILLPLSVTAHHALMDGYHVAQFIERLQQPFL